MSSEVRRAEPADYLPLAELQRRAVLHCLKEIYDADAVERWAWSIQPEKFAILHGEGEEILVCADNEEVFGFSSYRPSNCHLGMWYVDPDFQGQGIGKSLLVAAEEGLGHHQCEEAWTEASLFAKPRFETLGWTIKDEYDKAFAGSMFRVAKMTKVLG